VDSSPNRQEERKLVDAAKAGQEWALTGLYDLYFPRVYRYVLSRTGETHDAEDLTEEVFIRVLDAVSRFEWRDVPFSAWIFRIAHNAVISHRRRNGSRPRLAPLSEAMPIDIEGPELQVEKQLLLGEIMEASHTLPETQQRVISLRFFAGLTIAETARVLGKGEANIKVIQHKAVVRLREIFAERQEVHVKTEA